MIGICANMDKDKVAIKGTCLGYAGKFKFLVPMWKKKETARTICDEFNECIMDSPLVQATDDKRSVDDIDELLHDFDAETNADLYSKDQRDKLFNHEQESDDDKHSEDDIDDLLDEFDKETNADLNSKEQQEMLLKHPKKIKRVAEIDPTLFEVKRLSISAKCTMCRTLIRIFNKRKDSILKYRELEIKRICERISTWKIVQGSVCKLVTLENDKLIKYYEDHVNKPLDEREMCNVVYDSCNARELNELADISTVAPVKT